MTRQLKSAYADLYAANEYAHKLGKDDLISKLKTLTGASADDEVIPSVAGTFLSLVREAKFNGDRVLEKRVGPAADDADREGKTGSGKTFSGRLGISYTINLNLPATTEIEVFNAIFKALKEHILDES